MSSSSASSPPTSTSRTYADALDLLNTLIPNTKVHALFGKPQDPKPPSPASDPNLLAVPEMRAWLLRANLTPQRLSALSCVHIAGTKGKGSVAALTTSALLASARSNSGTGTGPGPGPGRVGTYTSPHLVTPRERIAIDGRPVSQSLFAAAFFELWDLLSACPADDDDGPLAGLPAGAKPFYFRFLTLLALHIFLREGVRSVVLECGIGGEYDATNAVVRSAGGGGAAVTAAVITQLGVDHVAMLGDTPEAIAWHKAGVMKPGVPAFTRRLDAQPAVMDVLRARAREAAARLVEVPDDDVDAWPGVSAAKLPGGAFQKRNQALAALAAAHHLRVLEGRHGVEADTDAGASALLRDVPETVVAGLREATLRGRHEVLERGNVSWHLDGAHNTDSLAEAARWMAAVVAVVPGDAAAAAAAATTKFALVFNQQERDASALLLGLLREMEAAGVDVASRLDAAIFTRNDKTSSGGGAEDAGKAAATVDVAVQDKCAAAFRQAYPGVDALVCRDLTEMKGAVDAVAAQSTRTRVLVTGSMYLVGNVIGLLEPDGLL
ncbi:Mur ligase [Colletotrichum navitas]|uniref:tetrahydrofolate synthase n=1 Tax=Colletotrichum navitas TaxID=681940 RepID=A0AAD8Q4A3_9PEZI|nr:Mur ligase [Colletotrichum navitas]KAK1594569.1 Mur ligase [Colletotrichum navitas]